MSERQILIAEDRSEFQILFETAVSLFNKDASIDTVTSGGDLILQAGEKPHDLIITDYQMLDHITGTMAIRELRSKGYQMPIYLVSSHDKSDIVGLVEDDSTFFYSKNDFDAYVFARKIQELFRGRSNVY
jgi:CheY-like chemotaxis protein